MNGIFGKKRNLHPECLLDSETVDRSLEERPTEEGSQTPKILPACTSSPVTTPTKRPKKVIPGPSTPRKSVRCTKKKSVMESIRMDRKIYQEERLKIEREKLELIEKRNKLIAERNIILKENIKCSCQVSLL